MAGETRQRIPIGKLRDIVHAIAKKIIKSENLSVEDIRVLTTQAIEVSKLLQNADRAAKRKSKKKPNLFGDH